MTDPLLREARISTPARPRRIAKLAAFLWTQPGAVAALLSYALGVVLRCAYALNVHPPRHSVYTDAANMIETAERMLAVANPQTIYDTVWPPGTAAFAAFMLTIDPTMGVATHLQLLASCLVPLIAAHTTYLLFGRRTAWFALFASSLHFGYIHYVGYFLSEAFFQFITAIAIWATVATTSFLDRQPFGARPRQVLFGAAACGLIVGLSWGCATLFRPNALPVALLLGASLFVLWLQRRMHWKLISLVSAMVGVLIVLIPAADRCTTVKGGFCPVSSNGAMNVALGQANEVRTLRFVDSTTGEFSTWTPPSLGQWGYQGVAEVPASIFDSKGVLSWTYDQMRQDPAAAATRMVGNSLDLFRFVYWPELYGGWDRRMIDVASQLFWLLIVAPALVGFLRMPMWLRQGNGSTSHYAVWMIFLAVVILSALSMGEPRYRVPFDTVLIALAGWIWFRPSIPTEALAGSERRTLTAGLVGAGFICTSLAALIILVSHPGWALAEKLGRDLDPIAAAEIIEVPSTSLAESRMDGSPWNYGATVVSCQTECPEVRVTWSDTQTADNINVSTDRNDNYRVQFYLGERVVGTSHIPQFVYGNGLRSVDIAAPEGRTFDAIGVMPMFGDGKYSIGHIRLGQNRTVSQQPAQ